MTIPEGFSMIIFLIGLGGLFGILSMSGLVPKDNPLVYIPIAVFGSLFLLGASFFWILDKNETLRREAISTIVKETKRE